MIASLTSYSLQDFIPFTAEVYLRMLERMNENDWPLHVLMYALTLFSVIQALGTHRHRTFAMLSLSLIWLWVAVSFLYQSYAQINWAATWFAAAFGFEALLLVWMAIRSPEAASSPPRFVRTIALLIAALAMAWPVFSPVGRSSWAQCESVGIHADPSAVLTLGILLLLFSGWRLWLLTLIPILWCIVSMLTLKVLGLDQFMVLMGILVIGFAAMIRASRVSQDCIRNTRESR